MSISAVDSSLSSCTGYGMGQTTGASSGRPSSDEIAASIFEKDDADGDGLLSLSETPLDEDRFNSIDTDGDGFLTEEELSADAEARHEQGALQGQLTMMMQGIEPSEMVASIFEQDDADGDGLLSFDETPLDEDKFNSIDTDGDGFISTEELTADMEANMAEAMPMPPAGAEGQVASASGSGGSESSSSSSESEEYDTYDLNQDGTVSLDELLQAFQSGDASLKTLFESMGEGVVSGMQTRMAINAYEAQMI